MSSVPVRRAENGDILADYSVEGGYPHGQHIPAINNSIGNLLASVSDPRGTFDISRLLDQISARRHGNDVTQQLGAVNSILKAHHEIRATARRCVLEETRDGNELIKDIIRRDRLKHKLMTTGPMSPEKIQYAVEQQSYELEARVELGRQYVRETARFSESMEDLLIETEVRMRRRGCTDEKQIQEALAQASDNFRRAWEYRNGGSQ